VRAALVTPWPLDTLGGAQALTRHLAEALAPRVTLTIVTGRMPGERTGARRVPVHAEVALPVTTKAPPGSPPPHTVVGETYLEGLEEALAAARPSVILYTPHNSSQAHQSARAAERLGLPFALWPLIHLDHPLHVNRTAIALYRSAALLVASSEVERRWLVERAGAAADRLVTLGCGPTVAPPALPRRPRPAGAPLRLLSVGEFAPRKRLEDQIEALSLLVSKHRIDATLTLAGVVRETPGLERLAALAERRGLGARVRCVPNASEEALSSLYAESDLFLFTSRSESYGIALLDAACAGTVPVVYPHAVYRQIVDETGVGLVAARETPRALADAVLRALSAPASDAAGRAPSAEFLEAHSWPRIAGILAERLERVTG
jgi:glycosyltransferase involved in cell wall biosynthesis